MKQIIQKLKQIKKYCSEHDPHCTNCVYESVEFGCIWMSIVKMMQRQNPEEWDVEEMERRIYESGR